MQCQNCKSEQDLDSIGDCENCGTNDWQIGIDGVGRHMAVCFECDNLTYSFNCNECGSTISDFREEKDKPSIFEIIKGVLVYFAVVAVIVAILKYLFE